jgi:hypothetical protein
MNHEPKTPVGADLQSVPENPEELKEILSVLYKPAISMRDADELLAGYEVMEAVTPYCTPSREFLFTTLREIGFKTTNVDNILYWMVRFNTGF